MARRRVTIKKRRRIGFSTKGKHWFDRQAAHDAVEFIETYCTHVKGEWAGDPFLLEAWEKEIIENLFGWKRKDAKKPEDCTRQYRSLWLEIGRRNGKSILSAAIALLLLFWDNEPGAEIYSAAGDREQAAIVFDIARTMRDQSEDLSAMSETFGGHGGHKRSIVNGNSFYRVLSSDAFTKHGLNAHGIVVDEVHVQRNRDLIDTLRTSVGSRRQPIEIYITTAGVGRENICFEMHDYAEKVIKGIIKDDTILPYIYAASEKDDWTDPKVWAKANPGLGISPKLEYLQLQCDRAKNVPGYQNTFRRFNLNQWTEQEQRWLDMRKWDACKGKLDINLLAGAECYAGLDLANTTDIAALVLLFEFDTGNVRKIKTENGDQIVPIYDYHLLPRFWVPQDNVNERAKRDKVPYDVWIREGLIKATEGNVIDYDVIRADINALGEQYNIKEIAIDRWNATQITTQLMGDGFEMVSFGQGFKSMSSPTKELEGLVISKHICHILA